MALALLAAGCAADEQCVRALCGPCLPPLSVTVIADGAQPPLPLATVSITYADGSAVDFTCGDAGDGVTSCVVQVWPKSTSTYLIHAEAPGYAPADLEVTVKSDGAPIPDCGCAPCGYVPRQVEMRLEPTA